MRAYVICCAAAALLLTLTLTNAMAVSLREQPSVVRAVAPIYPETAAEAGESGTVTMEAQVDARGVVTSVRTIAGLKFLDAAAEASARQWVFAPAKKQTGTRVVRLTFTFRLMPIGTRSDEMLSIFVLPTHVEVRSTGPRKVNSTYTEQPMSREP